MNKILIITYYWPPSGGAGVQRWLKFSKYLPSFGWEPLILTVDPGIAAYPVKDESLAADIAPGLRVYTTKTTDYFSIYKGNKSAIPSAGFATNTDNSFKGKLLRFVRGNFFIPDPRKGWNRHAYKKAAELIEKEGINHIITTSPPHSTQLIGLKLKKHFPSINWISDLRDPWTDIYYYDQFYPTPVSKSVDRWYEHQVLRKSDRIIAVGNSLRKAFSAKLPEVETKIEVISNGYDGPDFELPDIKPSGKFVITYVGTLSDVYPVTGLISALQRLTSDGRELFLRFVGSVSAGQRDFINASLPAGIVEYFPYVTHDEAVRYMTDTSMLVLIIPEHHSNKSIITGKIFEYLASYRPVICLGPVDGDAAEILRETAHGETFSYSDSDAMYNFIDSVISGKTLQMKDIKKYSRKELTARLVEML